MRPGDDEFALQPFQAFFVQKPVDVSNIEFKAEDRITKSESINKQNNARARRIGRGINPERLLINLYDKYCTFVEQYVKLGNQLNTARATYDTGMGAAKAFT